MKQRSGPCLWSLLLGEPTCLLCSIADKRINLLDVLQNQYYSCSELIDLATPLCGVLMINQGTLSDGLLAWRFYIVYGRSRWAFWFPTAAIAMNTSMLCLFTFVIYLLTEIIVLGLTGDLQRFAYYRNPLDTSMMLIATQINAAWGWCMLGINTVLTTLMIWRIMYVLSRSQRIWVLNSCVPLPFWILDILAAVQVVSTDSDSSGTRMA